MAATTPTHRAPCPPCDGLCARRRPRQPADGADRQARQARGLFRRQDRGSSISRCRMRSTPASGASAVATQYKAHSLIRHLQRGWNFFRPERNESFDILPASQRVSEERWYSGTADAVYQNIDIIEAYAPKLHRHAGRRPRLQDGLRAACCSSMSTHGADVTVGCLEVPRLEATGFGVMHDRRQRPHHLLPREADGSAGHAGQARTWRSPAWASMSSRRASCSTSCGATPPIPNSSHDFGKDIIPASGQERQGGGASLRALLRALRRRKRRPIGATSARSMPISRPISTSPTSCPTSTSTTRTGRSGPMPR